uniref:Uncharacterized protein n=1 Tax=Romanomermis culicivorax TaxID=13658 RepID=A0A915KNZ0_ROMCU
MLNETTAKISAVKANAAQLPSTDFRTNSNNIHGQRDWRPRCGAPPQRAPYVTTPTDSSCASSQSLKLPLALPAFLSSSTITATTLDMRALNQSTSTANMVIPSKKIASAAPIVSPGIVCWNATSHASRHPCHICSSVC